MLNVAHVEGFVTRRIWQINGDMFFRLAVYRDPDRPRKEAEREAPDERDKPDYITIRVPAVLTTPPVKFRPGQRLQIHGWLESREFDYTLAEFLGNAQGPKPEVTEEQMCNVTAHRTTTWMTAERIVLLPRKNNRNNVRSSK